MENQRAVLIPRKYKLSDKWKTPWCIHKNVLHINYFISCHRKKDAAHDKRVGCTLYSDWLFFLSIFSMFATAHTSEANDSLFFSPPEIPRSRPGIPMYVSAHFVRPSFGRKTNGNGHRIPWIPFDSAETDLDDSSILGYPTDTSLPPLEEVCCTSPLETNPKISCPCPSIPHAGIQLCL